MAVETPMSLFLAPSLPSCLPKLGGSFRTRTCSKAKRQYQSSSSGRIRKWSKCSAHIPAHFNSVWYRESVVPVDVDLAGYHVRVSANENSQTDFHFVNEGSGMMGVIDYPLKNQSFPPVTQEVNNVGSEMISHIEKTLLGNKPLYSDMPVLDLSRVLLSSMNHYGAPPGFSAIIVDASTNVLRLACVGACGLLLIRDDKVFYRTYPNTASSLIEHLPSPNHPNTSTHQNPHRKNEICEHYIHSDFIELQANDLVIAGTDGLFANLTDLQMLAFVRPVPPDHFDKTLSIANNTCLGSWTSDDVEFISYYLASLATNFSTAQHSPAALRYPFPPSPHSDDVTVLCLSCTFT